LTIAALLSEDLMRADRPERAIVRTLTIDPLLTMDPRLTIDPPCCTAERSRTT
jgi:hypothetical protein